VPKGRLYNWEGTTATGRQNLETRLVESLLVVCLSAFAISNRCSKDNCCAHKGLVTNWPHHNSLCTFPPANLPLAGRLNEVPNILLSFDCSADGSVTLGEEVDKLQMVLNPSRFDESNS
jgi:hypothetical protein